jgi:hypothetical protein
MVVRLCRGLRAGEGSARLGIDLSGLRVDSGGAPRLVWGQGMEILMVGTLRADELVAGVWTALYGRVDSVHKVSSRRVQVWFAGGRTEDFRASEEIVTV